MERAKLAASFREGIIREMGFKLGFEVWRGRDYSKRSTGPRLCDWNKSYLGPATYSIRLYFGS